MYYELTNEEIKLFIKRYFDNYNDDTNKISKISRIDYKGVKEYLINDKYIFRVYKHDNTKF